MRSDDIAKIVKGEVTSDSQTIQTFSRDASVFEVKPEVVVSPRDSADIKSLVRYATANTGVNLTPRSAGTCMSGGPLSESIVLDMLKHFNQIIEVGEDYAVVQPGVFYRDFEKATLDKGLLLPCYTASREINTVGGMVGNNSAGEKTLKYGQTKDFVRRLKVILSDGSEYQFEPLSKIDLEKKLALKGFEGEIYKQTFKLIEENIDLINKHKPQTHKNSTGYNIWDVWEGEVFDLTKLLVGSQGTLGIITEIEFKLIKPQTEAVLLEIILDSSDRLDQIVNEVLNFNPECFEFYDDQTLQYAVKFLPELIKSFRFNNPLEVYIKFLPDFIRKATGTLPKLVLLANFTSDSSAQALVDAQKASEALKQFNIRTKILKDKKSQEKYWIIRHESFSMLRHHSEKMRTAPFIDDITVKPQDLPAFLPRLNEIIAPFRDKMIYTVAGHIGDGNFHIIPLMDLNREEVRAVIPELSKKVFDLVFEFNGSMAAEHNDGLIRGPYLPQMYGEDMYQLFKQIKEIFDPKGIFNPNKKADATFEYSFSHLAKN